MNFHLINRKWFSLPLVRNYCQIYHGSQSSKQSNRLRSEQDAVDVCRQISNINTRLGNLALTAEYLRRPSLLGASQCIQNITQNETLKLPSLRDQKIESPASESSRKKTFIQDVKVDIKEPEIKSRISEPITKRIKKHAARMITVREKKMKKHRRKRLWDRMYLKFRANKLRTKKNSELAFRGRLSEKVTNARKFDAKEYVNNYLEEYHKPLIPGTYQGKRLPQWLIIELMEADKLKEKEALLEGKTLTNKETIVKPGETVEEFIQRTWK